MKTTSKKKPDITGVGFEFTETPHKYYLDGVELIGVTTVLGVIAKPALIQWAANEAVGYVREKSVEHVTKTGEPYSHNDLMVVLDEARTAHAKKKEKAGQQGTDVHAILEKIIKDAIEYLHGYVQMVEVKDEWQKLPQVEHFLNWALSNNVKFLASEERVFSRLLWIGGTIDFVCEIAGETWLGDFKTSSGIYPEHFFQTAGYQRLWEDMAKEDQQMPVNFKGHIILNLRKDGTFEEKRSISNQDNLKAFLGALDIYRVTEKIKSAII